MLATISKELSLTPTYTQIILHLFWFSPYTFVSRPITRQLSRERGRSHQLFSALNGLVLVGWSSAE